MLDIRKSPLADNLYADQLGNVYKKDKHGDYLAYSLPLKKNGYQSLNISRLGKRIDQLVHRVVASAFHGECPDGFECAHLDGIRTDNRAENLSWVSHMKNQSHQREHGTLRTGERHGMSKLTEEQVRGIRRKNAAGGYRLKDLATVYNVSVAVVGKIVNYQAWIHVS